MSIRDTKMLEVYSAALENQLFPYCSMGFHKEPDYSRWPKTLIMVAGNDPLRDEGLLLATKLCLAG